MKLLLLLIILTPLQLLSQNLVLNPSFEETKKPCAEAMGDFERHINHWSIPTFGSSDIFNTCSTGRTAIPFNFSGHQEPKFGEKYAGAYFFHAERRYREYIQGTFSSTLKKGKKYRVSFYVSLAETSDYAIKDIGFLLSNKQLSSKTTGVLSEDQLSRSKRKDFHFNIYEMKNTGFYDEKNEWFLLSKEIEAIGGENFIVIGNFKRNRDTSTKLLSNDRGNDKSYYYLDMVSVEPLEVDTIPVVEKKVMDSVSVDSLGVNEPILISDPYLMELDKSYIFENILFDFDSAELSEPAKDQIEEIFNFLMEKKDLRLSITGHTDNIGSKAFNQRLSEARAKSVAEYLLQLGLAPENLNLEGYSFSNPITSNKTDQGRSLNRRVEFRISKK